MYLLDTNVVSELRKATAGKADICSITVLELELGVLLMERRDARQALLLRTWMQTQVLPAFEGRILAVDTAVALRCAALHVPDPRSDRDALLAATALAHAMTMVTRNTADFQPMGVALLNPWNPHP